MERFVVPHDLAWARAFEIEAHAIKAALSRGTIDLHHIGSTAIAGILAKPIIDLLGVVDHLEVIDRQTCEMGRLGYEVMGAYGIEGRRYFRKMDASGERTHHLHVFARGSSHILRHLAFRDYLRHHGDKAAEYSSLKASLTSGDLPSWEAYMDGKDPFIATTELEAVRWYRRQHSL